MQIDCLVCGRRGEFWTRKAERDVWRCASKQCALIWVPEGLVVTEGGASIYEGDTPIFLQDGNEAYYLDETNLISCRQKVNWLSEYVNDGATMLDAGANFGHFLSIAKDRFHAVGVELSKAAVEWSKEHFSGVDNHAASIYALPEHLKGPYKAVTLFDVIEHVPQPKEALAALHRVLEPGGHLFLSTPDAGARVAKMMGSRWHYLDPIQHIILFNRENLSRLLREAGFEVLSTRTFGHHYRVGYVLDRLAYLHDAGILGRAVKTARIIGQPAAKRAVYINLGDVMGIVARRS